MILALFPINEKISREISIQMSSGDFAFDLELLEFGEDCIIPAERLSKIDADEKILDMLKSFPRLRQDIQAIDSIRNLRRRKRALVSKMELDKDFAGFVELLMDRIDFKQ